ncbi:uncharacterized protein [Anabrus simplex]|uniref:uncharacterized protein n=1 Tax=Anabrus simplex TaxID=316456 RepID=UPI0035A3157E
MSKYREVFECKHTDGLTRKEKDEAWEKVCEGFNSNPNITSRTAKHLRQFYINIKRLAKKAKGAEQLERFKTGGGPYTPTKVDETVLSLIEDQIEPCTIVYDCDAEYFGDAKIVEVVVDEDLPVVAAVQQNEWSSVASSSPMATTHLENSTAPDVISLRTTPKTTKDKTCAENPTKQSARSNKAGLCHSNITELAESRTSLCKNEMHLKQEKYSHEIHLLQMQKETEWLRQQTEKLQQEAIREKLQIEKIQREAICEKLLYLKEKRLRIAGDYN